jgi:hypothetical protein
MKLTFTLFAALLLVPLTALHAALLATPSSDKAKFDITYKTTP